MSADQINKTIAGTQGWDFERMPLPMWAHKLPNYYGTLDAIVPVVRALPKSEREDVLTELMFMADETEFDVALSTPPQWCEAYLKAKGLWNNSNQH